ncbi:Sodium-dependent phosphate transport protein 3, partial [Cricetulus griseus]
PSLCSMRYGIALLTHFSNFTLIAQNSIISITMVAMVNNTDYQPHLNSSTEGLPADLNGDQHEAAKDLSAKAPVYNWSPQTQGFIFSSAQYGMMLMQGPAGFLAGKIGTKKVVGIALLASSVLTLCIPVATNLGLAFLLATRAVQGLTQGTGYGGQFALWQRWAPPNERSRLCSIALSGMILGTFAVLLVGGVISEALGWPFVFYIFGAIGCVFCLVWFILVYDDPVSHPWISDPEKEYILSSLHQQVSSEKQPLPIKAILTSLPVWSMCLCTMTHQWLVNTFMVYTPTYISSVFKVNIRDNGFLSSLPFIVAWAVGILGGQLADFLLKKNFRLVTVRKIITILGNTPPAALIVALPYVQSSYITSIAFLTLSCGISPLCQSGIYINALDIAPRLLEVPGFCSFRYGLAIFLHFCNIVIMAQRVCLNLTMVAMVNSTEPPHLPNGSAMEIRDDVKNPVYSWSLDIQGLILSSVFSGMIVAQIPVGYLAGLYPMKRIIGSSLLLSSVLSLLIPPAAQVGAALVIVCRVLQGMAQASSRRQSLPMKAMLKSLPVWAIVLNTFAFIWSNSLLVTYTPTFINTVLHVNIRENGLLSSLSYLLAYICGIVAGQLSDFFLSRKIFSTANVRKLFTTIGILCPVIFTMCLLYLSNNFYSTIVFLTLANSTLSFSFSGHHINALDIAPSPVLYLCLAKDEVEEQAYYINSSCQKEHISPAKLWILEAGNYLLIMVACFLYPGSEQRLERNGSFEGKK